MSNFENAPIDVTAKAIERVAKRPTIIYNGKPTSSTPGIDEQLYCDDNNNKLYICKGNYASGGTIWEPIYAGNEITVDSEVSPTSSNPVANNAIKAYVDLAIDTSTDLAFDRISTVERESEKLSSKVDAIPDDATQEYLQEHYPSLKLMQSAFDNALELYFDIVNNKAEMKSRKVQSIDSTSTESQYPSAKAVYDYVIAHQGEAGATFIPNVSDNGVLSFTNDKGLENPKPVDIVAEVLECINITPSGDYIVYGVVDSNNVITLMPNGLTESGQYTIKYEDSSGNTIDIGTIEFTGGNIPSSPVATNNAWKKNYTLYASSAEVPTNTLAASVTGEVINARRKSNGNIVYDAGQWLSGIMPMPSDGLNTIYLKNASMLPNDTTTSKYSSIVYYTGSKADGYTELVNDQYGGANAQYNSAVSFDEITGVETVAVQQQTNSTATAFRIMGVVKDSNGSIISPLSSAQGDNIIITINEAIKYE